MPDPLATVLRALLLDRSTAALATLHDGRPAVSMIPFAACLGPSWRHWSSLSGSGLAWLRGPYRARTCGGAAQGRARCVTEFGPITSAEDER